MPGNLAAFLFTDIEGSTRLWEEAPDAMRHALARHDELLREQIARYRGEVFKSVGDGFYALFAGPEEALRAAVATQALLEKSAAAEGGPGLVLRVRMAIHCGAAEARHGDYYGPDMNRLARILAIARGGQILVSLSVADRLSRLPDLGVVLQDLGLHRLRDIPGEERIYQVLHPELSTTLPPARTASSVANNLPVQTTSFVGRLRELQTARRLLKSGRLVTIVGTGGAGKTRLALQLASELVVGDCDGVWLVELASVSSAAGALQATAAACGVRETAGASLHATLREWLSGKRVFLVLDNCEHLAAACAELSRSLLECCPGLTILATSRAPLSMPGECLFRLAPLAVPQKQHLAHPSELEQFEAVRFFVERARSVHPQFELTQLNSASVGQLCAELDGIPLALELAAARLNVLTVAQIAERIHERFRLLTQGARTALPQHRSLRTAIDWSVALLTDAERMLFYGLGGFAGPFRLEGVDAVASALGGDPDEVLDLLSGLVDKSLVAAEEVEGSYQYRLLETLRAYARERLRESGQESIVDRAVFAYCLATAEASLDPSHARGGSPAAGFRILEAEHDNLRGAFRWALDQFPEGALQLGWGVRFFWLRRGYWSEGRELLRAALERSADAPLDLRARAAEWAGVLAYAQGDFGDAHLLLAEAYRHYQEVGEPRGLATVQMTQARILLHQGNFAAAHDRYERCREIFARIGRDDGIAACMQSLGTVSFYQGRATDAIPLLERSIALHRELRDPVGEAESMHLLGRVSGLTGDYCREGELYEQASRLLVSGSGQGAAVDLANSKAYFAWMRGDLGAAGELLDQSECLARQLGARELLGVAQSYRALLSLDLGDEKAALRFALDATNVLRAVGSRQAAANAMTVLGWIFLRTGATAAAGEQLAEALTEYREMHDVAGTGLVLHLQGLAVSERDPEGAGRFLSMSRALFAEHGLVLRPPFAVCSPVAPLRK